MKFTIKIGKLEISWNGRPTHPLSFDEREVREMKKKIEKKIDITPGMKSIKVRRIKALREFTPDFGYKMEPKWGLKEQRQWVEEHYSDNGMGE